MKTLHTKTPQPRLIEQTYIFFLNQSRTYLKEIKSSSNEEIEKMCVCVRVCV